ncbi:PAS domain S-box protein [Marinobacterium sediminicola]|uniref:PAS domain S-box-containing protein n=1 Tax=Marinobacterium sediminicola TaxID=518898 RepID=A0ABY1S2V2_9GAMM|nr:PAS domain S-box protein [Marinobacterium sediminicola]ULG70658.1 PAS domain S-box protein [Marinobacterium sediminicola]SMR77144.1 PAS domain S-box-containing protein [Marinobacterium sediminicola]
MQIDAKLDESSRDSRRHLQFWQSPVLALLILVSGLALSFYLSSHFAKQSRERLQDRFQATVQQTTRVIQEKVDRFSLLMMAGRGLVLNNPSLNSAELNVRWHRMFDSFNVNYGDIGVVGLSFTRFIAAHSRETFIDEFNRNNSRKLTIFPPPADNQPSLVVMHLVPKSIEDRVLGYDIMSEEKRRQAVLETLRTGKMVLSRPLSLLPTDINSLDYLQMLPVRSVLSDGETHFLGVVTIGFSMSMLINSSLEDLPTPMRIQLIDTRESLETPGFDTHPDLGNTPPLLSMTRIITIGKHSLTLRISSLDPSAISAFSRHYDTATLMSGISITLMLTLISMFFIVTRQQALQLSRNMAAQAEEMYQRYESLFAQSPEAIVVHVNGKVELANQHAARLFGCGSPDELYQRDITELVHPTSIEFVERRREILSSGSPLEPAEQLLLRCNGQPFMAEVSSSLINYQGQEGIQVVFRDITAAKQQRLEHRMASTLFEHSADSIMVTDNRGKIEMANPSFQRLTGYSSKSVIGRTPDLLNAGHHSSEFFYKLWSSAKGNGFWRGDIVNRRKNGQLYIQETEIHSLRNETQDITHFVCFMRDVTQQRDGLEIDVSSTTAQQPSKLPNRLHFHASAESDLRRAKETNTPFEVGIIRIGHPSTPVDGTDKNHDQLERLSLVAQILESATNNIRVALLSDHELAIAKDGTASVCDGAQLRKYILKHLPPASESRTDITVAIARYPEDGCDLESLMLVAKNRADQA